MKNAKRIIVAKTYIFIVAAVLSVGLWGCGGGGGGNSCNRFAQTGCDSGLSCELLPDGTTGCFAPVVVQGKVTNLADNSVVSGARIVALDANGSPISDVATSDSSGNYQLTVLVARASDGTPAGGSFTLRADAAGFQSFPTGLQQPIPISTAGLTETSGQFVINSTLTNIGLIALPAGSGTAAIHGTVGVPENSLGTLVVAESAPTVGFSAIADRSGDYKIFNLAAGNYTVNGYVQGSNYTPGSVTLTDGQDAEVNLSLNSDPTATFNGSAQIVNAPGGSVTSVILVVESTFNDKLIRGEMPPGLRAPPPPTAPNVSGSFSITGIPAGKYVVLAAFENDGLVRDPDMCISGTQIIHQTFTSGQTVDLSSGFKITAALGVISPGAGAPESISTTTPTFTWQDDSSEDTYLLTVYDSFGNKVWETTIPGVSGATPPNVTYNDTGTGKGTATALKSGMYYQFKATSLRKGGTCEISQTEDLKGVFFVQ
jgi:hypothetical protein